MYGDKYQDGAILWDLIIGREIIKALGSWEESES